MSHIFGAKWKQYGTEPSPVWVKELKRLTIKEFQRGYERCKEPGAVMPDLPTFLIWSRPSTARPGPWLGSTEPPNYKLPALPSDQPQLVGRDANMKRIRELLGKNSKQKEENKCN